VRGVKVARGGVDAWWIFRWSLQPFGRARAGRASKPTSDKRNQTMVREVSQLNWLSAQATLDTAERLILIAQRI